MSFSSLNTERVLFNPDKPTPMLTHAAISFIGKNSCSVNIHRHYCYQIVIAIKGTFNCTINGTHYKDMAGLIINKNVPHEYEGRGCDVIVNFIDSVSRYGRSLRALLGNQPFLPLPEAHPNKSFVFPEDYEMLSSSEQIHYLNTYLEQLIFKEEGIERIITSPRVIQTIEYIDANFRKNITLEELAANVFISPTRLRHLFSDETGIPISQYILWRRIKQTLMLARNNNIPLSIACIMANFTDQAHFNNRFRKIFGVPPMAVLRNIIIQ